VYKIDFASTPLPVSDEPPRSGELLTAIGIIGGSAVTKPVSGRAEGDLAADIFDLPILTQHGSNGGPIFNSFGKAIAIQLWRKPDNDLSQPVKCLRLPAEWLSHFTSLAEKTKPAPSSKPGGNIPASASEIADELAKKLDLPLQTNKGQPHPLEVQLFCTAGNLPINIPPNTTSYLVAANEELNKKAPYLLSEPLVADAKAAVWPPSYRLELSTVADRSVVRCGVSNQGRVDLFEVFVNINIRYDIIRNRVANSYDAPVVINPLLKGSTVPIYIVNSCPADIQITLPNSGTAKPLGEDKPREFTFINPVPSRLTRWQLNGSGTNWTGNSCN
jgi:hypothetical protein